MSEKTSETVTLQKLFAPLCVPIHREGWPFIGLFFVIGVLLSFLWLPFSVPCIVLLIWCIYFFRDPERITFAHPNAVIAPADGVIQSIITCSAPKELNMPHAQYQRVAIFMNVFDVHVNRMPIDGTIVKKHYKAGKFFNASLDKASTDNESNALLVRTKNDVEIGVVQIAGLVARRILCWSNEQDLLSAGQRFGMIRFGSRVDLYLPESTKIMVSQGQRAIAGETLIAFLDTDVLQQTPDANIKPSDPIVDDQKNLK